MEENRAIVFRGASPAFSPCLLEAGVYTGAELPDEAQAVWHAGRPKADYFLFHGLGGTCRILCRQKEYPLAAGCVLLLDGKQPVQAHAQGEGRFAAFRFRCEKGRPPLRVAHVYHPTPAAGMEKALYAALSEAQAREEPRLCRRASLLFALLTEEWLQSSGKAKKKSAAAAAYEADIRKAVTYLQTHLEEKIQLSELARELHLSERNFRKRFTEEMGVSPKGYLQTARLQRARELLRTGERSINEISEAVGYYSQFQFSRDFKKEFGLSPSAFRGGESGPGGEKQIGQKKKWGGDSQ